MQESGHQVVHFRKAKIPHQCRYFAMLLAHQLAVPNYLSSDGKSKKGSLCSIICNNMAAHIFIDRYAPKNKFITSFEIFYKILAIQQ